LKPVYVERQNLEIAIQTVLHLYRTELSGAAESSIPRLIREMAGEIARKATMYQSIKEKAVKEMGGYNE